MEKSWITSCDGAIENVLGTTSRGQLFKSLILLKKSVSSSRSHSDAERFATTNWRHFVTVSNSEEGLGLVTDARFWFSIHWTSANKLAEHISEPLPHFPHTLLQIASHVIHLSPKLFIVSPHSFSHIIHALIHFSAKSLLLFNDTDSSLFT